MQRLRVNATLLRVAGALSLLAAGLHGAVTERHFEEWWGYGLFFVLAAIAQAVLGLVLFALAHEHAAEAAPGFTRLTLRAGVLGNVAIVTLYLVTRTVGIPFLGPEAGRVEGVGGIDLFSKAAEAVLVLLLVALLVRSKRAARAAH